jgi:alkylation response protein AidB-like acyl-CoA dehydrogenase
VSEPTTEELPDPAEWAAEAEAWLEANAKRRPPSDEPAWGVGSDDVALFHNLDFEAEKALIDELREWQRLKSDAGYGSITWPVEYGGAGLPQAYEDVFSRLESRFVTPPNHEAVAISLAIEAPTILALGTPEQKERYIRPWRRCDELCCQLFSEPGAGSDLGSIATRAERDGDSWVLNGQKVWTSGAQYADFGYIICRTDPTAPRQRGMTAFVVAMDSPGIDIRPLRQLTGGSSFNEVFFTDVVVPDANRIGEVGGGWGAMLTTLAFERAASATGGETGTELVDRIFMLARHTGKHTDPVVRQLLARTYIDYRVRNLNNQRANAAVRAGGVPGPEGSIGKLAWTEGMRRASEAVTTLVGPALVADTGEWGTYAWNEFILGAAGYRIAGGSDEIQRNTIAERVLGLPREPR